MSWKGKTATLSTIVVGSLLWPIPMLIYWSVTGQLDFGAGDVFAVFIAVAWLPVSIGLMLVLLVGWWLADVMSKRSAQVRAARDG